MTRPDELALHTGKLERLDIFLSPTVPRPESPDLSSPSTEHPAALLMTVPG